MVGRMSSNLLSELASKGYWPALAMEYFMEGNYSRAIELCMMRLRDYPDVLSGRIVYARSLYHAGQFETAEEQFYKILQYDPSNPVALKYLGDLKFSNGDETTAFSYYSKILDVTPDTRSLVSPFNPEKKDKIDTTTVLTLKKKTEKKMDEDSANVSLREMPFKTETLGDLLLKQGHPRLALKVFRDLAEKNDSVRLRDKIEKTEQSFKK